MREICYYVVLLCSILRLKSNLFGSRQKVSLFMKNYQCWLMTLPKFKILTHSVFQFDTTGLYVRSGERVFLCQNGLLD